MDLFDIEVFLEVANRKSMNKASKALHISQSAVSSRIAKLEADLDTVLFERSKKGVSLTFSGKQFYSSAEQSLNAIKKKIKALKELKRSNAMKIGITNSLSHIILPVLSSIIYKNSTLEWKIVTGSSRDLLQAAQLGEIDIAIINNPLINNIGLDKITLFEEKLMLIGPSDYKKNWIDIQYFLQDSTFILPVKGMPLRKLIDQKIFNPLNTYPKKLIEVNSCEAMKEFVSKGVGFAFLSLSSLWQERHIEGNQYSSDSTGRLFQLLNLEHLDASQQCICVYSPIDNENIMNIINLLQKGLHPYIDRLKENVPS
ncbi:LysR family transcriptional regulator [Domibacillus epiphyticus]|uniref:HTH lysR-type domain-containing protein n=1 Tax=Domibacillus epiphyticus TaxID=1714355 RepID=A0A1V2A5G7_9BACI|nr:LysR family transcriptional regulator [Domibacillus epiphyticus]OMP66259.1 hypothetical protein BTO28_13260 [Domibacillus epiphyticus]